jgi:tetratricopeptide (TPR) repeat protein
MPEMKPEHTDDGLPGGTTVATGAEIPRIADKPWFLAILLVVLTFLAYIPALRGGFVWDDDAYVTRNPLLTAPDGLERIWFSAHHQSQYFPLVYTTLRFEHTLWGLRPAGYHFVNILFHALNALLVWVVLRRLALPGSWLAAAIWAVHPVNVESVAWITELKNTQSTLFYLLAVLAWMKFTARETGRPWRFYGLALVLQALALFSKTTACTLPAALLLVLWLRKEPIGWRRLVQVAPFLALGVAMGLISVWWEAHLGNYGNELDYSFNGLERLLIATHALWFYVTKLVWPAKLAFSYPRWEIDVRDPRQYTWLIGCVAMALFLWWRRRVLGRAPVAAVVFFVAALSPLLGFIPLYTFRYTFVADHYQYVASIGLIALFAAAVSSRVDTWQLGTTGQCALSVPLLFALGALTWRQAHIYRDAETLWRDTLTKNPRCWMAHLHVGNHLLEQGRVQEAIRHDEQAVEIKPDSAMAHYDLGNALLQAGRIEEAVGHYQEALRIEPGDFKTHTNLGNALQQMGRVPEAAGEYEQALRIKPNDAMVRTDLGIALQQMGRLPEAIREYMWALRIKPDYAEAHVNLGNALLTRGKAQDAMAHYEEALRINPDYAEAHMNFGNALLTQGKVQGAIGHYEESLRIKPDYPQAHDNLGIALAQSGRVPEAMQHWEQALKLKPDDVEAHCNLGNALREQGQIPQAIEQYEQALKLRPDLIAAKDALAQLRNHQ